MTSIPQEFKTQTNSVMEYKVDQQSFIENKIYNQRLQSLSKYLYISQPVNIFCASLILFILYSISNHFFILLWYAACILISFIRLLASKWYLHSIENYKFHLRIFVIGIAISAGLWGIAGSVLMPSQDIFKQMMMILIITGITAGGLQTLQASFGAGLILILFSVFPLSIWVFLQSRPDYKILGFLILLYIVSMALIARRNYKIFLEILNLRYENIILIKSLESTNDKLKYLSTHDTLTGLPNRSLFDERFTKALAHSERLNQKLALLFIDLDHFKYYNDKYGHDMGDSLLIQAADRLTKNIRKNDLIARMGGDEFVVLIEELKDKEELEKVIQRILNQFADPFFFDKGQLNLTLSIGISIYPDHATEKKSLLKAADIALYKAKTLGRDRYEYFSD